MAELAGPLRVMKIAIQTAKIAYPALDGAGFDIVPKKDKPDADRP
jgi:hypothetical protein